MKPNKRKACLSALSRANIDIDESKVPEFINREDRNHYHVIIVKSVANAETNSFDHTIRKQTFNHNSYEIFKATRARITTDKVFLLHHAGQQKVVEDRLAAEQKEEDEKLATKNAEEVKEAKDKATAEAAEKLRLEEEENDRVEQEKADAAKKDEKDNKSDDKGDGKSDEKKDEKPK